MHGVDGKPCYKQPCHHARIHRGVALRGQVLAGPLYKKPPHHANAILVKSSITLMNVISKLYEEVQLTLHVSAGGTREVTSQNMAATTILSR